MTAKTEASKTFSLIAGPHTTKDPAKRKAGCYHIHENIENVFGSGYVGQSILAYKINIQWWMFLLGGLLAIITALITISFQSVKAALANPVKSIKSE